MRGSSSYALAGTHAGQSLAARGAAIRTFSSFATSLALAFLGLGIYIIQDEFAHPLSAPSFGVFIAAVVLACSAVLLYYLIQPRRSRSHHRRSHTVSAHAHAHRGRHRACRAPALCCELRRDLPFQRWYVDPARIPPRRP
jgi:uncharacterized membrane protein YbhN (UPF0104 family)